MSFRGFRWEPGDEVETLLPSAVEFGKGVTVRHRGPPA